MRFAPRGFISLLATALLLSACGGGGDSKTPTETGSISLSASQTAVTIARGSNNILVLSLGRTSFNGAITLTAEGVPTGVTVDFTPSAPSTGATATATINVSTAAAPGTTTMTLRASGTGVEAKTVAVALTVPTPTIALTLGSSAVSTPQAATVTVPITVARSNGAFGTIALVAEGLPANVTAEFTPSPISTAETTSSLTFVPAANAAVGTYPIVVRATVAGLPSSTATVQLTITSAGTPSYTLASSPATVTAIAGQTATSQIAVTRSNGFAGPVALTLEGAPAGVTGAFSASTVTGVSSTLTLTTTSATAPGTYNITVRGTALALQDRTTSVSLTVFVPPGLAVAVAPTSLTLAQGANAQAAIALTRIGGLTGFVTMSAVTPNGIVAEFDPATIASASSVSSVNISVGNNVAAGTYNVEITASGVSGVTATTVLPVTVFVVPAFTMTATNVAVIQGTSASSTITLARVGGFAGNVSLTASGVPANVTASFAPASAGGNSSVLTFTAAANATPGTYTITVNGTGTGVTARSATLTLTITASGGTVAWRFCSASRVPLWFGYRNGTSGVWTRVTPTANNTFSFTLTGTTGSVAYVQSAGSDGTNASVFYLTTPELIAAALGECANNPTSKILTGSFAGLSAGQTGWVYVAGVMGNAVFPTTTSNLAEVSNRLTDLLAFRSSLENFVTETPDRVVLRRNVNYPANSEIPEVDLAAGVAPVSANITIGNLGAEVGRATSAFQTANGTVGSIPFGPVAASGGIISRFGIPTSLTQAGDFHVLSATGTSVDGTSIRTTTQYNREFIARTVSLGASLALPSATVPTTVPYVRVLVRGAWQSDYGELISTTIMNTVLTSRAWTITSSRAFFGTGAADYELEIPDLAGVLGFNNVWAPPAGVETTVITTGSGAPSTITEGTVFKTATRAQTIIP